VLGRAVFSYLSTPSKSLNFEAEVELEIALKSLGGPCCVVLLLNSYLACCKKYKDAFEHHRLPFVACPLLDHPNQWRPT